jgi:hypothetical protein
MEFLDFKAIAEAVKFEDLLNILNIPFTQANGELKGDGFIVTSKNRYTNPTGKDYGNVINFLVNKKGMTPRDAASWIKKTFLSEQPKPQRPLPTYKLAYCKELEELGITEEVAKQLEIGKVVEHKGKSAGKIAFRIRSIDGTPVGYCIYDPKKKEYFYYSQYKHDHLYNLNNVDTKGNVAVLFEDPINAARHHSFFPVCISLTVGNLTSAQTNLLRRFDHILIVHHDEKRSQYLVNKLSQFAFVMATKGEDKDFQHFASLLAMSKN